MAPTRVAIANGISSIGAFLRVAQPDDPVNNLYLDLNIPIANDGVDPIDSLQVLIDNWAGCINTLITDKEQDISVKVFPNPATQQVAFSISSNAGIQSIQIKIHDVSGRLLAELHGQTDSSIEWDVSSLPTGIYIYNIIRNNQYSYTGKISVN